MDSIHPDTIETVSFYFFAAQYSKNNPICNIEKNGFGCT